MPCESPSFVVRRAVAGDLDAIVDFNLRLADETEGKRLDASILRRGVARALEDSNRLRYWVAASREDGRVIGQTAASCEWSDWRDGWFWWLQSVYVAADHRGVGVFRSLYAQIREEARTAGDVVGIRLYVEVENDRARRSYRALGMTDAGYAVLEEVWGIPSQPETTD